MKRWVKLSVLLICLVSLSDTYAWRELTVTKTDSLASLAEKYHPVNVSRMDMVIAIRNVNPHVFSKASGLKPGVKLLLPTSQAEVRQAIKGKYPSTAPATAKTDTANLAVVAAPVVAAKPVDKVSVTKTVAKVDATKAKAVVVKKPVVSPSSSVLLANQNATTIKSLQDTVSSQTQAIQNYQSQVNQLNAQLNIANQQIQSLQAQVGHQGIFTLGNLWLTLWLLTLGFLFWQQRKYKSMMFNEDEVHDDDSEQANDAHEPEYVEEASEQLVDETVELGRQEPQLLPLEEAPKAKTLSENWEQVELDIPEVEPVVVEQEEAESTLPFERYDDRELAGEQDDIIKALSQDENNMEWHQALLEFYVKTNSQNGFKRHYQTMVKSGMMTEGDPLWEQVRKMYLNKWIYQAI